MQKFFEKGDITLFQGDCIEILNKAAPESVDMIFADPPYMLSNGGITCQSGKVVSVNKGKWDESKGIDEDFEFHQKWINACKKPTKNAVYKIALTPCPKELRGLSFTFISHISVSNSTTNSFLQLGIFIELNSPFFN
jgi:DNA modification methylase